MGYWEQHPELAEQVIKYPGTSGETARHFGLTRAQVGGLRARNKGLVYKSNRKPRSAKRPNYEEGERRRGGGDWDTRLLEPWAEFHARKKAAREAAKCR